MRRLKKAAFKGGAAGIILLLALIRCACPGVTDYDEQTALGDSINALSDSTHIVPTTNLQPQTSNLQPPLPPLGSAPIFADTTGARIINRIRGVSSYDRAFPDVQETHLTAATEWGVQPIANREEAERRKNLLTYVGSNPYYVIDPAMTRSIPYLVPRAADLLQTIARNFVDSLAKKGLPAHRIIVSSVLRTTSDVQQLQRGGNVNSTVNSCHLYGTTFDISYVRYRAVSPPGETRRTVRDDTLKWVLSEVLRDVRESGRCYIKHERRQPCFHITVR